jgi:hypothetical protein
VDVLSGKVNPAGRLVATWPKTCAWPGSNARDSSPRRCCLMHNSLSLCTPNLRICVAYGAQDNETLQGNIGNYSMIGTKKTYRFGFPDPLFPFGWGLSYTSWRYSGMVVHPTTVQPCENVSVVVTVHNSGPVFGTHVEVYSGSY